MILELRIVEWVLVTMTDDAGKFFDAQHMVAASQRGVPSGRTLMRCGIEPAGWRVNRLPDILDPGSRHAPVCSECL